MTLRSIIRVSTWLVLAAPLSGCLQPVNAPALGNASLAAQMAQISVAPIEGYLGYSVKSELDFLFSNGNPPQAGRYLLVVKISTGRATSIIDAATARPQSVSVQAEAVYELRDTAGNIIRASGKTFGSATYDRSSQRFATIRAQRDAEERLGKALAERLRIVVTAALAGDPNRVAPPAPSFSPPIDPLDENRPLPANPGDET
jgi:LPS-assembly lipoprotein